MNVKTHAKPIMLAALAAAAAMITAGVVQAQCGNAEYTNNWGPGYTGAPYGNYGGYAGTYYGPGYNPGFYNGYTYGGGYHYGPMAYGAPAYRSFSAEPGWNAAYGYNGWNAAPNQNWYRPGYDSFQRANGAWNQQGFNYQNGNFPTANANRTGSNLNASQNNPSGNAANAVGPAPVSTPQTFDNANSHNTPNTSVGGTPAGSIGGTANSHEGG